MTPAAVEFQACTASRRGRGPPSRTIQRRARRAARPIVVRAPSILHGSPPPEIAPLRSASPCSERRPGSRPEVDAGKVGGEVAEIGRRRRAAHQDDPRLRRLLAFERLEPRQLLSVDLTTDILNAVNGNMLTGSQTFHDVSLGGFLTASDVTVDLNLTHDVSGFSGTVGVKAVSASLAFGASSAFTATIHGPTAGDYGLTGQYSLHAQAADAGSFHLTASELDVAVPGVFNGTATGISIDYDTQKAADQPIAQVDSLAATIVPFHDALVTLTGLKIAENGFSLDHGTFDPGSLSLGGIVSVDSPQLTFDQVAYSTTEPLSGTITLETGQAQLFPGVQAFNATVDNFSGTYDLGQNTLDLKADDVQVNVGSVLHVEAEQPTLTADVTGSDVSFGASLVKLDSPDFPDIKATVTSFQAGSSGLSFDDARLEAGGT